MMQIAHISFAILCMFASFSKNVLIWRSKMTVNDLARIRIFDKLSASAAGLLSLSGLSMIFWLAKPSAYYLHNGFFLVKMALFVFASALVVWTKIDFRKAVANDTTLWVPPNRVRFIMAFDLVGLFVLAALGRGIATGLT